MGRLDGKVALITGGGGGIGRSLGRRFLEEGANVVLMGRSQERLEKAATDLDGLGDTLVLFPGSVAVAADCKAVVASCVERWGRVDVVVNNAAIDEEVLFIDMSEAGWDAVLNVNLKGPFLLSQAAAKEMIRVGDGGSIVHVSSIDNAGADGPYTSYNVSKTGLLGLSRCMAVELARYGIRSNVVSPGATRTEMIERVMGEDLMDYMLNRFERVPLQRLVEPDEVANACVFFASSDASGITGVNLPVDCGTLANIYMFETMPVST